MTKNSLLSLSGRGLLLSGALLPLAATYCLAQAPRKTAVRPALAASKLPAAMAETPTSPPTTTVEARADALTANMTQGLGLTPAQVEKVRAINTNSVRSVETARQRYRQDPGKLRGYIEDIGEARIDRLKDVLTPAQFGRYQQKREEKMGVPTLRGNQGNQPPGLGSGE